MRVRAVIVTQVLLDTMGYNGQNVDNVDVTICVSVDIVDVTNYMCKCSLSHSKYSKQADRNADR